MPGFGIDRFVFYPERGLRARPDAFGLAHEDVAVRADDGVRLACWWIPAASAPVGRAPAASAPAALLWFHGNAGTMADRLDQAALFHRAGLSLFMVGYRGYGESEGRPTERGLRADAIACLREARRRSAKVVLFGQSLGGAVAIDLATREKVDGVIAEAAFTSLADMVGVATGLPLGVLFRGRFDSLSKIVRVGAPLLVVHGDRDEVVPAAMGGRLFAAAREPKQIWIVRGASHNDVFAVGGAEYFDRVRRFCASAIS